MYPYIPHKAPIVLLTFTPPLLSSNGKSSSSTARLTCVLVEGAAVEVVIELAAWVHQ